MSLKKSFLIVLILSLCCSWLLAQDSLQTNSTRLKQDQLISGESYEIDTIIDGQTYYKKSIKAISAEIPEQLLDDEYAAEIDKKWLETRFFEHYEKLKKEYGENEGN